MMIRVHLFAVAREIAGTDCLDLELGEHGTAGDVAAALAQKAPSLERVIAHSIVAVDGALADASQVIPAGAEVALIPPVSGG